MAKTPNLQLTQPTINSVGWANTINGNWAIIDAAVTNFFQAAQFKGIWANATNYVVGDTVVDTTTSELFTCNVIHTSASSPTTFAADRIAHATYWTNSTVVAARGRGSWTTATAYLKGDFVNSGTKYAVATANHTSGATFVGDAANWSILIDVSAAVVPDNSLTGAKLIYPFTLAGQTIVGSGGLTVTAGGITVVAGATTLQGTTIQSGGLTVTAGGVTITAGGINIVAGGLSIASGGITIVGNSSINGNLNLIGALTAGTGITVTTGGVSVIAGGVGIVGNSNFTGSLTVVGALSSNNIAVTSNTAPTNGLALAGTNLLGLYTNGGERVHIGALGQLGIGGANYGTAGQAIVSAGSGAPIAWGNVSSVATVLATGSMTGTAISITGIPATYTSLSLVVSGASHNNGANRAFLVRASIDNGATYSSTLADYINMFFVSGFGNNNGGASLVTGPQEAAAQVVTFGISIYNYRGIGQANFNALFDGSGRYFTTGLFVNGANPINALQILLDGAGSFDAGTYTLYGIK